MEFSNEITYDEEEDLASPFPQWMPGDSLAPPCQAELDVVDSILQQASPTPSSVIYDLGCGDGRICIEATRRYGCRSVGCEIEETLIRKFEAHIATLESDVAAKITIVHDDLRNLSLDSATIIVLYLLYESIESIKPKLMEALTGGAVLICNTWGPKGFHPVRKVQCGFANNVTLLVYDRSSIMSDT
jgi:SAM-dependent methyltransferase